MAKLASGRYHADGVKHQLVQDVGLRAPLRWGRCPQPTHYSLVIEQRLLVRRPMRSVLLERAAESISDR